jgi:hypothetical protein
MNLQHNTLGPNGSASHVRRQELGDLSQIQRPSLLWRAKQALGMRASFAQMAREAAGRALGLISFDARLHGHVYRADWARLAPEQALKLRVLLQAKTDLTPEQTQAMRAELPRSSDVRALVAHFGGSVTEYGLLSARVVTDAGVAFIVDAFQNITELENMKYHGYGTGTTNEAAGQTALVTELTTEYASDSTRPTGTTTEGATGNIYRTVATLSPDSGGTLAITEHGVFSATSAGTLLDRSKFAAINLVAASDSLQTTYELTLTSGS